MHGSDLKLKTGYRKGCPFIGLFEPFVGKSRPLIFPFVGFKIPIVGFRGFTLIEVVVTITIIGILAGIAVPNLNRFLESNRLTTLANDLIADISLARSEAIKTGAQTALCAVSGSDCGTSTNWGSSGWRVFQDADNSGTWTVNDTIIRSHDPAPTNNSVTAPSNFLVFSRLGTTTAEQVLTVCNSRIKENRTLTINILGRVKITQGTC